MKINAANRFLSMPTCRTTNTLSCWNAELLNGKAKVWMQTASPPQNEFPVAAADGVLAGCANDNVRWDRPCDHDGVDQVRVEILKVLRS